LFLKDAGIEVKDVRYPWDDTWPKKSEELVQQGLTRTGKLPVLEYNGLKLSQVSAPRIMSKFIDSC
jgi:glutathione S-transferase